MIHVLNAVAGLPAAEVGPTQCAWLRYPGCAGTVSALMEKYPAGWKHDSGDTTKADTANLIHLG